MFLTTKDCTTRGFPNAPLDAFGQAIFPLQFCCVVCPDSSMKIKLFAVDGGEKKPKSLDPFLRV